MDELLVVLRIVSILLTGLSAGLMVGHYLLLGRYIDWFLNNGQIEQFRNSYPVFLASSKTAPIFNHLFTLAILVSTVWLVLYRIVENAFDLSLIVCVGLQWLFVLLFFGSGFAALEAELFKRDNFSTENIERFSRCNLWYLLVFSLAWTGSLLAAVLAAF